MSAALVSSTFFGDFGDHYRTNGSAGLQNSSKNGFGSQSDKKSSLSSVYTSVQQNNNINTNNNINNNVNVMNRRLVTTTASVPINLSHSTVHRMQSSPTVPVMQQKSPIGVHNTSNQQSLTLARGMSTTASHQCSQNNNIMNGSIANKEHKKLDRSYSEPAEKNSQQLVRLNSASATVAGPMSSRYKTELCRSFGEVGTCKYGDKCQFAHGGHELRVITRHPKFKTENCKSFHSTGFCPYGPRCHFIHNNEETKKSALTNISSNGSNSSNGSETNGSHNRFGDQMMNNHSINGNNGFVSTYHSNGSAHPLRPKALSIGSYSLGSSGEISPPSSQSGSPTSLNSFFTEDPFHPFVSPNGHTLGSGANNAFSFSPDFASLMPNNQNKSLVFGVSSQTGICSQFPMSANLRDISEQSVIMPSMFSNQFQTSSNNKTTFEQHFSDGSQGMVTTPPPTQASKLTPVNYPLAPDSPVDSIASEVEAMKLDSNLSPPLSDCSSPLDVSKSLPRLPIFTRFANNGNNDSE